MGSSSEMNEHQVEADDMTEAENGSITSSSSSFHTAPQRPYRRRRRRMNKKKHLPTPQDMVEAWDPFFRILINNPQEHFHSRIFPECNVEGWGLLNGFVTPWEGTKASLSAPFPGREATMRERRPSGGWIHETCFEERWKRTAKEYEQRKETREAQEAAERATQVRHNWRGNESHAWASEHWVEPTEACADEVGGIGEAPADDGGNVTSAAQNRKTEPDEVVTDPVA